MMNLVCSRCGCNTPNKITALITAQAKYCKLSPIDDLDEVKAELLHSFGVDYKYCKDCKHWTRESDTLGRCKFATGYRTHEYETCDRDKWEKKE